MLNTNKAIHLKDLNFAERLLIVSIRHWVKSFKNETCTLSKIRYLFTAAGITGATLTLDSLMLFISKKAKNSIEINCPNCTTVSKDENYFLGAIAIWQSGQTKEKAEWLIRNWLFHSDNTQAQKFFAMLAYELKEAQFYIRPRDWLTIGLIKYSEPTAITQTLSYRH